MLRISSTGHAANEEDLKKSGTTKNTILTLKEIQLNYFREYNEEKSLNSRTRSLELWPTNSSATIPLSMSYWTLLRLSQSHQFSSQDYLNCMVKIKRSTHGVNKLCLERKLAGKRSKCRQPKRWLDNVHLRTALDF